LKREKGALRPGRGIEESRVVSDSNKRQIAKL